MTGPSEVEPDELAALVRPHLGTALVAFDVDGVLAPLVDHADDAELHAGVDDGLAALAERTTVAIVSGRAIESLERLFGFPDEFHVIGSHGLDGHPTLRDAGGDPSGGDCCRHADHSDHANVATTASPHRRPE